MEATFENAVIPLTYRPEFRSGNIKVFSELSFTGDLLEIIPLKNGWEIAIFEDRTERGRL